METTYSSAWPSLPVQKPFLRSSPSNLHWDVLPKLFKVSEMPPELLRGLRSSCETTEGFVQAERRRAVFCYCQFRLHTINENTWWEFSAKLLRCELWNMSKDLKKIIKHWKWGGKKMWTGGELWMQLCHTAWEERSPAQEISCQCPELQLGTSLWVPQHRGDSGVHSHSRGCAGKELNTVRVFTQQNLLLLLLPAVFPFRCGCCRTAQSPLKHGKSHYLLL